MRTSVLVLPLVGAFVSAIVMPGRGERRVLYGAAAMAAGIPFLIMIAMPAPTKLDTVLIFSLTAGFLVWAWLIVRDRRRVLHCGQLKSRKPHSTYDRSHGGPKWLLAHASEEGTSGVIDAFPQATMENC